MIQRLKSHNLMTDKGAVKVPGTIYWPDKKVRKFRKELSIKYQIPQNLNLASVSVHVRKKFLNLLNLLIQFNDQQMLLKKQQTV